ncbi:LGFP repeat-containing protein [Nocardia tengchongensis]
MPGKMRSDREQIPGGFSKDDADKAETMEAELKASGGRRPSAPRTTQFVADDGCQVYWPAPYYVCGAIRDKYNELGGPNSFLLWPASDELTNPDGMGKRSVFQNGTIYWSSWGGAHPVVNHFFAAWQRNGWEAGVLGYPTTDEIPGPAGGRRQEFDHGAIYWHFNEAYYVTGAIRDRWTQLGAEAGAFGYPISDETNTPPELATYGTRMNKFEGGIIFWGSAQGVSEGQWFIVPTAGPAPGEVTITPGPPVAVQCPSATVHPGTPFNCEEAWRDAYDKVVVARTGRSDSAASPGHGAFGYMHALVDHHMDLDAMGKIVSISRKVPIAGRMEYSAQFKVNGQPYVRAFVRTQESPQTEDGHLDEEDMGVITAYCKTESEAGEGFCPDWVNDTLGK